MTDGFQVLQYSSSYFDVQVTGKVEFQPKLALPQSKPALTEISGKADSALPLGKVDLILILGKVNSAQSKLALLFHIQYLFVRHRIIYVTFIQYFSFPTTFKKIYFFISNILPTLTIQSVPHSPHLLYHHYYTFHTHHTTTNRAEGENLIHIHTTVCPTILVLVSE